MNLAIKSVNKAAEELMRLSLSVVEDGIGNVKMVLKNRTAQEKTLITWGIVHLAQALMDGDKEVDAVLRQVGEKASWVSAMVNPVDFKWR